MSGIRGARIACTGSALLLAAVWGLGYGFLAGPEPTTAWFVVVGVAPLVLLAPGAAWGRILPTGLLGFASLFYMAHGFTELVANPDIRGLASTLSLLSLLLFLTASHALRLQIRRRAG